MQGLMGLTSRVGRKFAVAAALAAVLTAWADSPVLGQLGKPDIVVFMIDDLDLPTLQTLLATGLMPNVKSYFVDVGVAFPETYAVAGLGGPSRATFLTGQYPHNHGMVGNYLPLGGITKLNQLSTVATWMNTAGSCHEHTYRIIYLAHRLFDERGRAPGVVRDQLNAPQLGRDTAFRVRLPLHAEPPRRVED